MTNIFSSKQWSSSPAGYWTIQYEYKRSGADMQYRFYWKVWIGSASWFNDGLQLQLFVGGVQHNITVKGVTSGKGWSYDGTTDWYTVKNKTSGTTSFYAKLKDTNTNAIRKTSDTYSLAVSPAGSKLGTIQDFTIESGLTIPITKYNSAFTDTLQIYLWDNGEYRLLKTISGITNGTKVTFTEDELYATYSYNEALYREFRFILTTKSGSTAIGNSQVNGKGYIAQANPSFTASQVTVVDSNESTVAVTGSNAVFVLEKSTPKVTWTPATAQKRAEISNYNLYWKGQNPQSQDSTDGTTGVSFGLTASGNTTLEVTVKDSRGWSTKVSKEITVIPYSSPTAVITLRRENNYEDTTYFKIDAGFSSVVVDGIEKNFVNCKYRFKESGGSYGSWTTIADNVQTTLTLDKNKEFIFEVNVTDAFGTVFNNTYKLANGKFPLFIDTGINAVGVNAFPKTGEAFRVEGGKTALVGGLSVEGGASFLTGGATINNQFADDVIEFALSCPAGITPFNTDENTTNLPSSEYKYSSGYVHRRTTDKITIILYSYNNTNKIAMNTLLGETWSGWNEIVPTADYVVEQGTSGVWTYRKWNSGLAEVWLTNHQTLTNCPLNGSLMGGYYAQMNNPPFGNFPVTFTSTPTVTGHGALGSGVGFATIGVTRTYVAYVTATGNQNSTEINRISIKLIGHWK